MNKSQKIFFTICYFLIIATFIYVFSGILGLNLPRYYPKLGVFSIEKLSGPSMGYYGKVGFTLLLAIPLSFVFYLFLPWMARHKKFNPDFWWGITILSLLFGMMFFVAEEWHKWGIEKQKLGGGGLLNIELVSFFFLLVLFLALLKFILWLEGKGEK